MDLSEPTLISRMPYAARQRLRAVRAALAGGLLLVTFMAGTRDAFGDLPAEMGLVIRKAEAAGWRVSGLDTRSRLTPDGGIAITVTADAIDLPTAGETFRNLRFDCGRLSISRAGVSCESAWLRLEHPVLRPIAFHVRLSVAHDGAIKVSFDGLPARVGEISGTVTYTGGAWKVDVRIAGLGLEIVEHWLSREALTLDGTIDARVLVHGDGSGPMSVTLRGVADGLDFSNSDSTAVGETLATRFELHAERKDTSWVVDGKIGVDRGQLYLDPVFVEVPNDGIQVYGRGKWDVAAGEIRLTQVDFSHPGVMRARLSGIVATSGASEPKSLQFTLDEAVFPDVYDTYLQPLLIGSALDSLETSGTLSGEVRYHNGAVNWLTLRPRALSANDTLGRFALGGLDGRFVWRDDGRPARSRIAFSSGEIYRVGIGAGEVFLDATGKSLALSRPTRIPVLDGELLVETFELDDVSDPLSGWRFDGALTPVSMESVTDAIGWPSMSGKLSGMVPDVRYADGTLTFGGALLMRVFEGTVSISHLVLRNPFGVAPHLNADVRLGDIDLDALTRRFSFGRMTGRLDGHVLGLEMSNWAASRFDAWIGTPADDRSRHRISQKAVESITSIGGGATGVLSTGFLSLFKSFAYDRIGLNCRLRGGVCAMGGVAPAKGGGYYIVKGKWLPRIDVIGHSHDVDWQDLVDRLVNLNLENQPVIE
ncbi:MAG: hypothetical protein U9R74_07005 [Pseudomonadota bacterium]|nr:hypothetical protein [Pseudomonadota bacterium]